MAYYRLSTVVKMRRKALGVKRGEYDAAGPTGMTVYRMEEGKHKASERTYRQLTRSMGIEESTYQGLLKTSNLSDLQMTYDINRSMLLKDEKRAKEILTCLKEQLDETDVRNRQYIEKNEIRLKYESGGFAEGEYEKKLWELLNYRFPKGYEVDWTEWPLHWEECEIVLMLLQFLREEGKHEEQREVAERFLAVIRQEYMNRENETMYLIYGITWLADMLGNIGRHREAIQLEEENILLSEEEEDFRYLADIYYDIFWNYWMLKKKETLSALEEARCKECLLKAYYVDKAWGSLHPRYAQRMKECYPEEL